MQRADGTFSYQLAVVVDDIAMQITEVVRGADLAGCTGWQLALYEALGAPSRLRARAAFACGRRKAARQARRRALRAEPARAGRRRQRPSSARSPRAVGLVHAGTRCTPRELVADFRPGACCTETASRLARRAQKHATDAELAAKRRVEQRGAHRRADQTVGARRREGSDARPQQRRRARDTAPAIQRPAPSNETQRQR